MRTRLFEIFLNLFKEGCDNKQMEEFIENAKKIHGEKYNYSLVEFINKKVKIKIICEIHGIFEQRPYAHYDLKQGCPKCGVDKRRGSLENIIKRSIEVHGDKYDYSLVKYVNTVTKIKIICKIHGEFEQLPLHHISACQGCKKCVIDFRKNDNDYFIEKANDIHQNKYDYSLTKYISIINKVKIICKIHGVFDQGPSDHLNGSGCRKCVTDRQKSSKEEFIQKANKIHGNKYDYSLVEYTTNKIKVKIICKIHGVFEQKPNAHLVGHTCIYCYNKTEGKVKDFLIENNIKFNTQDSIDNKRFDFTINDDYILEIDGRQHFPQMEKQVKYIKIDRNFILQNDIKKMKNIIDYYPIIRLFQEHIWNNVYDWKNFLLNKTKNLKPGVLYIRKEEKDLYKNHTHDFKIKYI